MKVTDPVCGMSIESGSAAATAQYEGQSYYFCSSPCRDTFNADPAQYTAKGSGAGDEEAGHSRHGRAAGHRH